MKQLLGLAAWALAGVGEPERVDANPLQTSWYWAYPAAPTFASTHGPASLRAGRNLEGRKPRMAFESIEICTLRPAGRIHILVRRS